MKYFFLLFSILILSVLSAQAQQSNKKETSRSITKEITVDKDGKKEFLIKKETIVLKSTDHQAIDRQMDSLIQVLKLNSDEKSNVDVEVTLDDDGTKNIIIESSATYPFNAKKDQKVTLSEEDEELAFEVETDENRVDVEPLPITTVSLGVEINEQRRIVGVETGSAADKAGLQKGDYIEKIDDQIIYSIQGLMEHLGSYHAGDVVKVTYDRNDKSQRTKLQLDPK